MRNTYSKLNYHIIFSTKNRVPLIDKTFQDELYGYMGGILRGSGGVLLVAGGMPDHVHLLAGWGTSISVAKMLQLVKTTLSTSRNTTPPETPSPKNFLAEAQPVAIEIIGCGRDGDMENGDG
jgi:REP element-mobilizing transposase RayT